MILYVGYEKEIWSNDYQEEESEWYEPNYGNPYSVTKVTLSIPSSDCEAIETTEDIVTGDKVFVVYVSYDSGNTFGESGGYGDIVCVTKDESEAEKARKWAKDSDNPQPDCAGRSYRPWEGYFEHNACFHTESFIVQR